MGYSGILAEYFEIWIIELNLNGYCLNCSESQSSGPGRTNLYGHGQYVNPQHTFFTNGIYFVQKELSSLRILSSLHKATK